MTPRAALLLRSLAALAACLVTSTSTRVAAANAPAPYSRAVGTTPGVVLERASPVVVEREELLLDCVDGSGQLSPACSATATYHLFNPTGADEELLGAFYTVSEGRGDRDRPNVLDDTTTITLDGASVTTRASEEQLAKMDAIVARDPAATSVGRQITLRRAPFLLRVRAGARATLVFQAELLPLHSTQIGEGPSSYAFPAISTRHVVFQSSARHTWTRSTDDFLYLASPLSTWAGDPEIAVEIRSHASNGFSTEEPAGGWSIVEEAGIRTARTSFRASSRKNVGFRLEHAPFPVKLGGPFVGGGPRIARDEMRFRGGWEVGFGSTWIAGLAVETELDQFFTAAATLEAATPNVLILIPSVAAGLGVPVQVRRGEATRVGARAQLAVSWPLVTLVFPLDLYPAGNSSGSHAEGAAYAQFSF